MRHRTHQNWESGDEQPLAAIIGRVFAVVGAMVLLASCIEQPPAPAGAKAKNDTYSAVSGQQLTVDAPGVLGNDVAARPSDVLTATAVQAPTHGTLALASNGSFTYTSADGFVGEDTFSYRAVDQKGTKSKPATVTITVTAPPQGAGLVATVSAGGSPVGSANVVANLSDGTKISGVTDAAGKTTLHGLPDGEVRVFAVGSGYRPGAATATVSNGSGQVDIELVTGDVGVVEVQSDQLTPAQIVDAGINLADPENWWVYEFEIKLDFCLGQAHLCPETISGYGVSPIGGGGGGYTTQVTSTGGGGGGSSAASGMSFKVIDTPQGQVPLINYLMIPGKTSFLKEFFNVQMLVVNLAPAGVSFDAGQATLDIPEGLTLAPTAVPQTAMQPVDSIDGGKTGQVNWILRGDTEGEYDLTANFGAMLEPFGLPVSLSAQTAEPLKVWGASAIEMIVSPDDGLVRLHPYNVKIGLKNVSDTTVYNASVELIDDERRVGYIYEPRAELIQSAAEIAPGTTFWTDYILMPWIPGGGLDLADSFVRKVGGNADINSTIVPQTAPDTWPSISSSEADAGWNISYATIPSATGYEFYTTKDLPTPNGPQPNQTFGDTPVATVNDGSVGSVSIASVDLGDADWIGVSTLFADGTRRMEHPLTPVTDTGPVSSPVANNDVYSVDSGDQLSVPVPGVLGNDTPANTGDSLSTELVDTTTNGTLTLAGDGSFTYSPQAGFHGTDTFTYRAVDQNANKSAAATVTITVNEVTPPLVAPTAVATATPSTVETAQTVTFDSAGSTDPDGDIVSYVWDFGDSSTPGSDSTVTHAYVTAGVYTATLTVTDNDGLSTTATALVTVTDPIPVNQPPTALASADPITVQPGEDVTFTAAGSTDPDGTIVSYEWEFDDGHSDIGTTVTHSFDNKGTYLVTLTVVDDDGLIDTDTVSVHVALIDPPAVCTINWVGPDSGAWSTAANWSPARVPTSSDDACIIGTTATSPATPSDTYNVNLTGSATVRTFTIGDTTTGQQTLTAAAGVQLTITGDSYIRTHGTLTVGSSTASGYAYLVGDAQTTVTNNGTLNLNNVSGYYVRVYTNVVNHGTVNITGTTRMETNGTTYTNTAGSNTVINSGSSLLLNAGGNELVNTAGLITNNGTLAVSSGKTIQRATVLTGNPIEVSGGTLDNRTTSTPNTFTITGPTTLSSAQDVGVATGQTITINVGSQLTTLDGLTNNGTLTVGSSTASGNSVLAAVGFGQTLTNNGTLNLNSSSGYYVLFHTNVVNHGTINITGATHMAPISGVDDSTTYTNDGTTNLSAGSTLNLVSSTEAFTQTAGGTLATTVDAANNKVGAITGSGPVTLAGTLKVSSVGTSTPGTSYTVAAGNPVSGTFATTTFPNQSFTVSYPSNSVRVTAN